jgi:hypothetical protein
VISTVGASPFLNGHLAHYPLRFGLLARLAKPLPQTEETMSNKSIPTIVGPTSTPRQPRARRFEVTPEQQAVLATWGTSLLGLNGAEELFTGRASEFSYHLIRALLAKIGRDNQRKRQLDPYALADRFDTEFEAAGRKDEEKKVEKTVAPEANPFEATVPEGLTLEQAIAWGRQQVVELRGAEKKDPQMIGWAKAYLREKLGKRQSIVERLLTRSEELENRQELESEVETLKAEIEALQPGGRKRRKAPRRDATPAEAPASANDATPAVA